MSEVTQPNASDGPPKSVEIPLDNTSKNSSRKSSVSSASTSSFENVKAAKPDVANGKGKSNGNDNGSGNGNRSRSGSEKVGGAGSPPPASVEHEELEPKASPRSALAFKTTSLDDPTYYAETTSSSTASPSIKATPQSKTRKPFRLTMPRLHANIDRDPENVNEIVKIRFEEVFAEPEGTYSFGTIWGASHKIFTDTKMWCYKFLSAMCGVPCAFCWGIHFACLSFCQIWYCQPGIRSFSIQVKPMSRVYQICIKSFIEPCFETIGRLFSSIRVHVSKD